MKQYSCTIRHHDSEDLAEYAAILSAPPSHHAMIFGSDPADDWERERAERIEDRKARRRLKVHKAMMPKLPLARAWFSQQQGTTRYAVHL